MKSNSEKFLVVGSDSFIGQALFTYLKNAGEHVVGTTRRLDRVKKNTISLDLTQGAGQWTLPAASVAIICAGITQLGVCQQNQELSHRVNVTNTIALIEKLVAQGTYVIFLSTNQVFNGLTPLVMPDAPTSPASQYGRQKEAVEQQISKWNSSSVAIVRLTKVLSSDFALFLKWGEELKKGMTIHPFLNLSMAPVPLSFVVSAMRLIADLRLTGNFQLSGDEDLSYADAARIGASHLGIDPTFIKPTEVSCLEGYDKSPPVYTSLDGSRLLLELGIRPPDVEWTIRKAFS